MEHMHDKIDKVEQHPSPSLQSLGMMDLEALFPQHFNNVFPYRPDMCVRSPACDYEVVRHVGDAVQVQHYDVVGFHVETQVRGAVCRRCYF